jgi:hypothetical protein
MVPSDDAGTRHIDACDTPRVKVQLGLPPWTLRLSHEARKPAGWN